MPTRRKIRITATTNAKFGQPEANLGLVSGWGGSYRLPRRVGLSKAKELFFTGKIVDAEAACAMGLADFVGDAAALDDYLAVLLAGIRKCGPLAVSHMKHLLNHSPDLTLQQNCLDEAVASSLCMASEDAQARVTSYLESRKK